MTLAPGDVLMMEGEFGDKVYLLVRGALDISRLVDGNEITLARIEQPGVLVGEITALAGGMRTASVTAVEVSEVVELTKDQLQALVAEQPDLGRILVTRALERVEKADLAELFVRHFRIHDEETLSGLGHASEWRYLRSGETLFERGDPSDRIYFVVRGSLEVSGEGSKRVGVAGRGEVVGELGLLQHTPRTATAVAARDSVIASLGEDAFLGLVRRHPEVMVELGLQALERAARPPIDSPTRIIALLVAPSLNVDYVSTMVVRELKDWGSVATMSSQAVDNALGAPGASQAGSGDVGDIPVTRLMHQAELDNDYVVLLLGREPSAWSDRCIGMADRLAVVMPAGPSEADFAFVDRFRRFEPQRRLRTTLVLAHPATAGRPSGSALVGDRIGAEEVFHVRQGSTEDVARIARVIGGKGYALVLGGGGGRGFAHIGVLRAMHELGIPLDIVGGTSIGGVLGLVMADEFDPDEIVAWASHHFGRALDYTLPLVSLVKGRKILGSARETWGDRDIEDLWRTGFAISADLTTSEVHVHRSGSIVTAVRATSAIPGIMPPVPVGDRLLVDGGVLNNLPVDVARQWTPAGAVIACDVAPPTGPHARFDYGLSVSGWDALLARMRGARRRYPGISTVLLRSMIIASMRQRDIHVSSSLVDCHLNLDMRGVGMLDFDDPATAAQRGYESAMPLLESWLEARSLAGVPTGG